MKRHFINTIALLTIVLLSASARAEAPSWIVGKWGGINEIYEITVSSVTKIYHGEVVSSGEYYIDEDNEIIVDWNPNIGERLIIIDSIQKVAFYHSGNPLHNLDELTLPSEYQWAIGKWSDGQSIVEISEDCRITIYDGEQVVNTGIFTINENFINAFWEKSEYCMDGYMLFPHLEQLSIEGGDDLTKLPEKDVEPGTPIVDLFIESQRPYTGSIRWAYGEWHREYNDAPAIIITPKYIQSLREEGEEYLELSQLDRVEYTVIEEYNSMLGTVIRIGNFYLDTIEERVYCIDGFNNKIYLTKTDEYISSGVKYALWGVAGLIGIGILFGLFVLLRKLGKLLYSFGKKMTPVLIDAAKKAWAATINLFGKAKNSFKALGKKMPNIKPRSLTKSQWCLIAGGYVLLFINTIIGIIILVPIIAYLVINKKNPEKAEALLSKCKDALKPITSRSSLTRGLVMLAIGVFVFRFISLILGLIITVVACVYLICSKFAPKVSDNIDRVLMLFKEKTATWWTNMYVLIALCCLLLIFPFVSNAPLNSVTTTVAPTIESSLGIEQEPKEFEKSQMPTFRTPDNVFSFLSNHTFKDDKNNRLTIRRDAVYMNGRALTTAPKICDFNETEAVLEAWSPFTQITFDIRLDRYDDTYILHVLAGSSHERFYLVR